jgi:uncharacterized protein
VISRELLEILACPKCHSRLELKGEDQLLCPVDRVVYPIVDGIPVLLIEEARPEESSPTTPPAAAPPPPRT